MVCMILRDPTLLTFFLEQHGQFLLYLLDQSLIEVPLE